MNKVSAVFGRAGKAIAKHKKLVLVLFLLVVVGAGVWWFKFRNVGPNMPAMAMSRDYVRTVTLQKGTLDESISATGTVASDDLSSVTTDLKYTVKEVNVQVGDTVEAGDVICTLDTESLQKSIEKEKENIAESVEKALKNYNKAEEALTDAKEKATEAKETMDEAETAKTTAEQAYKDASGKLTSFQSEADSASSWQETKLAELNNAMSYTQEKQAAYNNAYSAWEVAYNSQGDAASLSALENEKNNAYAQLEAATNAQTNAQHEYEQAKANYQQKQQALTDAQNTVGYTQLKQTYEQAKTAYEQAKTAYEQATKSVETATETRDDALETYNKAGESDQLEELQEQLEECTLKAETSGKVTAVNATVGSMIEGAAATIQNTEKLKISISIAEYDIDKVQVGMTARITSDVIDGTVNGTVTQISPTASGGGSSSSSFSAEVSVDDANSGLLIGTNAKVEIVLSTTEDVFTVPLDAIETKESGESVIYVKTGETDGEATFEEVAVTVGEQNDYYAEISGSDLKEGLVVRASANLEDATESTDSSMMKDAAMAQGGFGMMNSAGAMPSGGGMQGGSMKSSMQGGGGQGGPGMGG